MRRVSAKRAAIKPDEAALKAYMVERHNGLCQWCEVEAGCDKHEIGRGKYRLPCLLHRCANLLVCRWCHGVLTRMASDDAERLGLAILKESREEDCDLPGYLGITSPNAPNRITPSEVLLWSRRLGDERDTNDAGRFAAVMLAVVGKRLTYRTLTAQGDAGFMGIR